MTNFGTATVINGKLYCRKQPQKNAPAWGKFNNNQTIPIKDIGNALWWETYWNNIPSQVGYVMKQFTSNIQWHTNEVKPLPQPQGNTVDSLTTIRLGNSVLKEGDTGIAVEHICALLSKQGYACTSASTYNAHIKNTVEQFQKQNKLKADGVLGQTTLAVLEDFTNDTDWFLGKGICNLTAGKLARIGFVGKLMLNPSNVQRLNQAINDQRFNFTEKIHIRHFLAQGCAETEYGKTFTEHYYHPGWTKAKYMQHSGKSYAPYYGAGFIQLTHGYNYQAFRAFIGMHDTKIVNPEEFATDYVAKTYPFISAAWFWCIKANLNHIIDESKKLSASATVRKVTSTIKGDSKYYEQRLKFYEKAKEVLL